MLRRAALVVLALAMLAAAPYPSAAAPGDPLPSGGDVDYQLGGAWDAVPEQVRIVVRDRTDEPLAERYNVCYVNGFQTQPDAKRFWRDRWRLVLKRDGRPVEDAAWGEWLLDLRTPAKRQALARIVGRWTEGCARDGFDAVEYDNLDSFTRSRGLLRRQHAIAYSRLLVRAAHRAGLRAGQKNLAGYDGTAIGFDFAVAEQCGRWRECHRYARSYGDQVLAIEYRDRDFTATCDQFGDRWPVVRRDLALRPSGVHAWC